MRVEFKRDVQGRRFEICTKRVAFILLTLAILMVCSSAFFTPTASPAQSRNLITEGSNFEVGLDGFWVERQSLFSEHERFPRPAFDDTTAAFGRQSLKLVSTPHDSWSLNFKPIALDTGKKYTLSAYMKTDTPGIWVHLVLHHGWDWMLFKSFTLTADWKRYSLTGTAREINPYGFPGIYWISILINDPQDSGTVWVDGLQLEEGDLSPHRIPNPLALGLSSERKFHLFYPDERGKVKVSIFNESAAKRFKLTARIVDDYYQQEVHREERWIEVTNDYLEEEISLPPLQRGVYKLLVDLEDATGKNSAEEEFIWGVIHSLKEVDGLDFFGTHIHYTCYWGSSSLWPFQIWGDRLIFNKEDPEEYFRLAQDLGFRWLRVFNLFDMAYVEPEEGRLLLEELDQFVDLARSYNLDILAVFLTFPEWAETGQRVHGRPTSDYPVSYLPDKEAWSDYVHALVDHYKGRVTHWEILNEPEYDLAPEEYLAVLRPAFLAAKEANPQAKILGPVATLYDLDYSWITAVLRMGALDFIDVFSAHFYDTPPLPKLSPGDLREVIGPLSDLIDRYQNQNELEIWNTEIGWLSLPTYSDVLLSISSDPGHHVYEPKEQAEKLVGQAISQMAAGIAKYLQFTFQEYGNWSYHDQYALLNLDDTPCPALIAFNAMAEIMVGTGFLQEIPLRGENVALLFEKEGTPIVFLWSPYGEGADISLPLDPSRVTVLDLMGNPQPLAGRGGLKLHLSASPLYLVGSDMSTQEIVEAFETTGLAQPAFELTSVELACRAGQPTIAVKIGNLTDEVLEGSVTIEELPQGWKVKQTRASFSIPAHEEATLDFPLAYFWGDQAEVALKVKVGHKVTRFRRTLSVDIPCRVTAREYASWKGLEERVISVLMLLDFDGAFAPQERSFIDLLAALTPDQRYQLALKLAIDGQISDANLIEVEGIFNQGQLLNGFETDEQIPSWEIMYDNGSTLERSTFHATEGQYSGKLTCVSGEEIAGIRLSSDALAVKDWSLYGTLGIDVYNPQDALIELTVNIADADQSNFWIAANLIPGVNHVTIDIQALKLVGPLRPVGWGEHGWIWSAAEPLGSLDLEHIARVQFYLGDSIPVVQQGASQPNGPVLYFDNLRLIPPAEEDE